MNTELTELVFILDRSGSMGGLESDTIGGFNGMIAKQKKQGSKVNVTTILFDDEVDIIHDRFPVEIIEPLTEKEYFVRGCTALLDAVGTAIEKMENVQKHPFLSFLYKMRNTYKLQFMEKYRYKTWKSNFQYS